MNHIRRLQIDRESLMRRSSAFNNGLTELRCYLLSPKFFEDTTVQVADILRRIEEVQNSADNAQVEYENEAYANERKLEEERRNRPKLNCFQCDYFGKDTEEVMFNNDTRILCPSCAKKAKAPGGGAIVILS